MPDLASAAVKTYRYLRVTLIVLIVALAASVILERAHATALQGSISAYYYTPAHSMLVGTLVGIGVCLIALKGSDNTEDLLLNIAGMLAPIVAFVPTTEPTTIYGSRSLSILHARTLVGNNVVALIIAGVVALGIAYAVARKKHSETDAPKVAEVDKVDKVGLAVAGAVLVVGVLVYWQARTFFLDHAHDISAIAMFVVVGVVVYLNSRRAGGKYKATYRWIALAMASGLLILVVHFLADGWRTWNFWLESLEILAFGAFWIVQTFELWDEGVAQPEPAPTPARDKLNAYLA